jgi:eukaryotic-like serine/threonine-protein kinase
MEDERETSVTVPALFESDTIVAGPTCTPKGEDRYASQKLLGEGGMAKVHLCRDERIGRDVAIKSISSSLQRKASARARFLREASIQGQLEHPSIVPVHDIGFDADGSPFLVMKRVRGRTLEEIIAGHRAGDEDLLERFSRRRLLNAFVNVCLAVDFAHSRGVIHRDLKPSNIMLGSFGEVYLLDWGVAKLSSEHTPDEKDVRDSTRGARIHDTPGESLETKEGALIGTPHYMAPEQVISGEATTSSDVFALGAILFEMLTGVTLRGPSATIVQIAKGTHDARCSIRAPERHVPPELEDICIRATARDPNVRYATARELSKAVEEYLEGDRDAARRRELASMHVENARRARATADASAQEGALRIAMSELGSALVLDPDNRDARALTLEALTTPLRTLPREVEEAFAKRAQEQVRQAAARWHWLIVSWLAFGPLLFWAGVRDVTAMTCAIGLIGAAAVLAQLSLRRKKPSYGLLEYAVVAATALAMVVVGRFFGPFVLVPTLLGTFGVALQLDPRLHARAFAMIVCIGGMVAAAALDWAGIPSKLFVVRAPEIVVTVGDAVREVPARVVIVLIHVSAMLTTALAIGKLRNELTRAEQRLHVYAWQVRAMLPASAPR